ncbi:MAG: SpoIIE family protein phosphatase [candidate division Zixibacteria bacterium]|nr:SpoIIE family protein phosphatase [candidate division Zixibacteria bacterium]
MDLDLVIAIVYLACAVLLLFVAVLVGREDIRKRVNRVTALMLGFAALGPLFYALGVFVGDFISPRSWLYNTQYLWELFFPQLVFFALCFPTETKSYQRFARLKYAIFLPHVFHLLLTTVLADPDKLLELIDPSKMGTFGKALFEPIEPIAIFLGAGFSALLDGHIKLFSTVNFAYVIIAMVILYRGIRRVTAPQLRRQVAIVIYGIISALALYMVAFIFPALNILTLSASMVRAITLLALILGCGSIVWAIIRYRFMDVRLMVRQSLVYTLTSALVVGAYVLIIRQLGEIVRSLFGTEVPVLDVFFIIIALILFQPVMSQLDDLIKRFFIRDKADYRNISENFSRQVASVFGTEEIFALTFTVLKNQMLFERAYICLKSDSDNRLCCVAETQAGDEQVTYVELEEEVTVFLSRRQGIINFDELVNEAPSSPVVDFLSKLRTRYLISLVSGEGFLGFLAMTDKISGYRLNYEDITSLTTIGNQLSVAITTSKLYQESIEKQRLEEEMNFARAIQRDLLPKQFPRGDDYSLSAYSEPSRQVGGDYFDFITTPRNTVGIVLADVSGKGMPAALLASQLHAAVRSEINHNLEATEMLANVNELVHQATSSEKFATLFFADFDPETKMLRYANAGHNYPIHLSDSEKTGLLQEGGLLLGAFPGVTYKQDEIKLADNDVVLFYTDGLSEAENEEEEQYGEERIINVLSRHRHLPPAQIQQRILEDVKSFAGNASFGDDMTLIVLKVKKHED